MFSVAQKKQIAGAVEKVLLDIGHPEMPTENPRFMLHVEGKEAWSWADIKPNWAFETGGLKMEVNPWNEMQSKPTEPVGEAVPCNRCKDINHGNLTKWAEYKYCPNCGRKLSTPAVDKQAPPSNGEENSATGKLKQKGKHDL